MKDSTNVIYLHDYIAKKKNISPLGHRKIGDLNLMEPKPELFKRTIAFGVDLMTIGLLKASTHTAYALFLSEFLGPLKGSYKSYLTQGDLLLHSSIFLIIYFSYFLFTNFVLNGKTLGKLAMGLRVIEDNFITDMDTMDSDLGLKTCFKRALGYTFCYLSFGTFFIFNFSSEDKRGLPDYTSGTRTVSDHWLLEMKDYKAHQREHIFIDIRQLKLVA